MKLQLMLCPVWAFIQITRQIYYTTSQYIDNAKQLLLEPYTYLLRFTFLQYYSRVLINTRQHLCLKYEYVISIQKMVHTPRRTLSIHWDHNVEHLRSLRENSDPRILLTRNGPWTICCHSVKYLKCTYFIWAMCVLKSTSGHNYRLAHGKHLLLSLFIPNHLPKKPWFL